MIKSIKKIIFLLILSFILVSCNNSASAKLETATNLNNEVEEKNNVGNNEVLSKEEVENVEIFVATDFHYISNNINDHGEAFQKMINSGDGRQVNYIEELVDAFVYDVMEKKPNVLIISGDLTHNGEKQSHLDLAKKLKKIKDVGTEVLVIPGNHDVNNPYAREFKEDKQVITDFVTPEEFEEIYSELGYSKAFLKDKNSLSYFTKATNDLWILMLDTNIYDKNINYPATNGKVKASTLEWIKKCGELAKDEGAKVVVGMHHNLYEHSDLLYKGFVLDNAEEVLEVFKQYNMNITLSGHIHIQNIMSDESKEVYDIATSAFVVYPTQYGILNYNEDGFTYSTNLVDVESWANSMDIVDENLLNYGQYSKQYFFNSSYNKVYNNIIDGGSYTEREAEEMAKTMSLLNVNYFGGTVDNVREEVLNSDGYKLWVENEQGGFLKAYILGMLEQNKNGYNNLEINN